MTEAVVGKLHNAFAIGATVEEACRFAGISRDAFYEHSKKNPKFTDTIDGVKDRPILKSKSLIIKSINDGNLSMAQWYLERKCKKEFSVRTETEHGVTGEALALIADIRH